MKLTAKTIATITLPPGKKDYSEPDDEVPGFYFRVRDTSTGGAPRITRTLEFRYKKGKTDRRMKLCDAVPEAFPAVREKAKRLRAEVQLGKDPAGEKQADKAAAKAAKAASKQPQAVTFKAIAELYIARQRKEARPRTVEEDERYLMRKAVSLHSTPITSITRRDIAELLTTTESAVACNGKKNGAAATNRMSSSLGGMFRWALREGLVDSNPVADVNKRAEPSRDRVLSVDELVEIWRALPEDNFGWAIKLLALTAQRKGEIGGLRWQEIDFVKDIITLPKHRTKNGREHVVPMSQAVVDIIDRVPRIVDQDTLFGSGDVGASNWGFRKAQLDKELLAARRAAFGADAVAMPHWTVHDLRRSASTHMAEICGVQPHIIECVLNHASGFKGGVGGVYNRAMYRAEVTAALTLWSEHLMAAITGTSAKVVPIAMGKAG